MPNTTLFEQLRPRLTAISCRIVGSMAEAEEIVQDSFLKWQAAERTALETPAAWLTTVVRHQSVDRLRKRSRDAAAAQAAHELAQATPPSSPEDALLRRAELGEALALLLARLSPSERLALVLHEVFDCEHADIAAVLGTKAATARQHLARARRRLRAQQEETPPDEKLCRELIRRFQAALDGMDVPAMVSLLGDQQPVFVREAPQCANDASYDIRLAA